MGEFSKMPYTPGTGKTIPIPTYKPGTSRMKPMPYRPKQPNVRADIEKAIMSSMASGGMFGKTKRVPRG